MTVPEAEKSSSLTFKDNGNYDDVACKIYESSDLRQVALMVEYGRITTVSIYDDLTATRSVFKTDKGIGLGSSISDILKAYGQPKSSDNPYGSKRLFYLSADGGGVRFDIGEQGVSQIEVGTKSVEYMEGCS